jgi:DNA modification methylase
MSANTAIPQQDLILDGETVPVAPQEYWLGHRVGGQTWKIYAGDARKILPHIAKGSFQCVMTSPPYFWQRDYGVAGQIGLEPSIDEYVSNLCETMDLVKGVLDNKGLLFLNLGDTYYSAKGKPQGKDRKQTGRRLKILRAVDANGLGVRKKTIIGIPWRVALAMISRDWILRCPIIWKRDGCMPEPTARDRPWRTHETVFMFSKTGDYYFSRTALRDSLEEDVWTIPTRSKAGRVHSAVFPPALVRRCLEIGCIKGGRVLDPFAGSGTVLKVATDLGHDSVGIDLNRQYCEMMASELGFTTLDNGSLVPRPD